MIYGLTGAHRAGKTTLAQRVSDDTGIPFTPIKTTDVAKRFGFNPVQAMPLVKRIELQTILFEDYIALIEAAKGPMIVDRTPLDHAAYLLAEIYMRSDMELSKEEIEIGMDLVNLMIDASAKYFDFIFYLAPLETYAVDPTKPPDNKLYQFHYSMILRGMIAQLNGRVNIGEVMMTDFEQRVAQVSGLICNRITYVQSQRKNSIYLN